MTYDELITAMQTYLQNDEATFVAELPTIVRQAEDRIYQMIQLPMLRKSQEGTLTASNRFLSAPSDFISVHSLAIVDASGDYEYLLNKDVNFIREAFRSTTAEGTPRFYALWDEDTFVLGPTPDAGLVTALHYFYKPESIVTAGTTWVGDQSEAALLYSCLVEAYTFMKGDPDLIQLYDARYKEALVKLKELGDGKNRRDSYRSGQTRVPVS